MFMVKKSIRKLVLSTLLTMVPVAAEPLIGIVQVIEHPALDQTRQGILDELKENGLEGIWESAQGTPALATQIVANFVSNEAAVVVAIGTVPAQIALKQCTPSQIPVVFSSVTDPKSAKLQGNITGVSNFVDADRQLSVIVEVVPEIKKLGVVYNPGEANSETMLKLMRASCEKRGIQLEEAVAGRTADVPAAAQSLMGKVDAVFVNNDNTALAAFESIVKIGEKSQTPVFVSDVDLVEKGAVAALGPDQYAIGRQTGKMIVEIVKSGKKAEEIAVAYPEKVETRVNEKMAETLEISLPPNLLESKK